MTVAHENNGLVVQGGDVHQEQGGVAVAYENNGSAHQAYALATVRLSHAGALYGACYNLMHLTCGGGMSSPSLSLIS